MLTLLKYLISTFLLGLSYLSIGTTVVYWFIRWQTRVWTYYSTTPSFCCWLEFDCCKIILQRQEATSVVAELSFIYLSYIRHVCSVCAIECLHKCDIALRTTSLLLLCWHQINQPLRKSSWHLSENSSPWVTNLKTCVQIPDLQIVDRIHYPLGHDGCNVMRAPIIPLTGMYFTYCHLAQY